MTRLTLLARWVGVSALCLSLAACSGETGPDTSATVNAITTAVRQTIVAQTPGGQLPTPVILITQLPPATIGPVPTQTSRPIVPPPTSPPATRPPATRAPSVTPPPALHIPRRSAPPQIDGLTDDWSSFPYAIDQATYRPENWSGLADQTALYSLAWDDQNLYVVVKVTDDVLVQTQHGENIFKGDSLEILLDTDLANGDNTLTSEDDYQLGIAPGNLVASAPEAYLWFPASRAGKPEGVAIAAKAITGGYVIEASIAWSVFRLQPVSGTTYGFALSLSDNDTPNTAEQQSMISSVSTRRLTIPSTWGRAVLD